MPRLRPVLAAPIALAVAAVLAAGCGSSSPASSALPSPLPAAPEPAVSPPAATHLPGTVVAFPGAPEGIGVTASGTVAVNVRQPDGVVIFPITSDAATADRHFVALGGSARHLTLAGPKGPALVPDESDDRIVRVALPGGRVLSSVLVGHQPHEAFPTGGDHYWVVDELANTAHILTGDRVDRVVQTPVQAGGGTASLDDRHVIVVGVRGRQVWEYTASGNLIGKAACGAGPTHEVTGSDGLFWVNDTNGGAVLGFKLTSQGPKQVATIRLGAGTKPYGIAYDQRRHTLWTALSGRDQLLGLTFSGTRIVHRTVYDTVRQPNTVAVDEATGELVVTGSTTPGQLQFIPR